MDKLIHPISGETGFFCTTKEKKVIDVALEKMDNTISSESSVENG